MRRPLRVIAIALVGSFVALAPSGCAGDPCVNAQKDREKAAAARAKGATKTDPQDVYNMEQVAQEFEADAREHERECTNKD